ncbi:hypothetical protein PGH07_01190 [Sulfurovum sp. zt1-1]|uniref:Uncharacterized protein n=1 Tax=Sulfurovum zhangzhouensis TaxID=3019067 RepID=A0ABT7QWT4_9BACT|nr:hypothetical protein [Sulfurovum zhangzhouensis]MDM5270786.1 hypothetical protein [Sulfurovum zhangzhouensis]
MKNKRLYKRPERQESGNYSECRWQLGDKFGMEFNPDYKPEYLHQDFFIVWHDDIQFGYVEEYEVMKLANTLQAFCLGYFDQNIDYEICDYMTVQLVEVDEAPCILLTIEYENYDQKSSELHTKEVFLNKVYAHNISKNIKKVFDLNKSYTLKPF